MKPNVTVLCGLSLRCIDDTAVLTLQLLWLLRRMFVFILASCEEIIVTFMQARHNMVGSQIYYIILNFQSWSFKNIIWIKMPHTTYNSIRNQQTPWKGDLIVADTGCGCI